MSIERVKELRDLHTRLSELEWSLIAAEKYCRFFSDGHSQEHTLSGIDLSNIRSAMQNPYQRSGAALVNCESQALGRAVKAVILDSLEAEIKRAAEKAADEARAVLAELGGP